jgi:hypothetical protein
MLAVGALKTRVRAPSLSCSEDCSSVLNSNKMCKYILHVSLRRWRFSRSSCSRGTRSTLLCAARRLPSADADALNARPASRPSQVTKGSGPACLTATCSSSSNNPVRRVAPCHRFRLMFAMFPGAAHKLRHGRKTASPHNCLGLRNCRGSIAAARQTRLNAHNETGSPSSINSKVTMHRPLRGSALVLV